ncbi:hypothetical protein F0562_007098 [Nyssa sinensis]|uniref:Uncharacterized protein n=1 Tax=Nyssa sinensis TaxID=561372 RepID=A0A5J5A2Y0_9ASTE|nr:hypothetical protein F0562_007098 [Nyssa sinensis]
MMMPETVCAVKAVLDMLGGVDAAEPPSPVAGFWTSPVVDRQLRVTDSPFPLKDGGEDCHVDEAAAEFIERFYKELRVQNRIDAREAAVLFISKDPDDPSYLHLSLFHDHIDDMLECQHGGSGWERSFLQFR